MKILHYGWILSNNQLGFGPCKMFPCGYISCKLPQVVIEWVLENELNHPDDIPQISYPYQHSHDGGLFNEALISKNKLLLK